MCGKALWKLCLLVLMFIFGWRCEGLIYAADQGVLKSFPVSGLNISSPALGADGTVYIGTGSPTNKLYAITTSDGKPKWTFNAGSSILSSPAVGSDGTIYFGSYISPTAGRLYAVNPEDGTQKWVNTEIGGVNSSSPAIGADGTIYIGSWDGNLYAVDPSGDLKWTFAAGDSVISSPAISSDGTIYLGSYSPDNGIDNYLYAINPDGSEYWKRLIGLPVYSPAIGADGTIYAGSWDGNLYAIKADGSLKWSIALGAGAVLSPVIDSFGTIYVVSNDGVLHAVNPEGIFQWSFATGCQVKGSPAVGADGTIFINGACDNGSGGRSGKLYALNTTGTLKWSLDYPGCCPTSSLTIGPDGTVYSSTNDILYAVSTDCGGQAESPWPMFHYDRNHTARIPNTTSPSLISTNPGNDQLNTLVNIPITATFDEVMDPASINNDTFVVYDGSINIAGAVTSTGKTAIFTPNSELAYDKTYTATITTGIRDPDGNPLAEDCSWTFTTETAPANDGTDGRGTGGGGCFISALLGNK